jgi:hypothetical protein
VSQIGRNAAIPYACARERMPALSAGVLPDEAVAGRTERWVRELSLMLPGERRRNSYRKQAAVGQGILASSNIAETCAAFRI